MGMEAIGQMEALIENNEGERPITVKIPSGITSEEQKCKDVKAAIELMKEKSPEHIREKIAKLEAEEKKKLLCAKVEENTAELQKAQTIQQKEEAKAKEAKEKLDKKVAELKTKKEDMALCQWMFADAGTGWGKVGLGGLGGKLAHLNPARWSSKSTMTTTQEGLEAVALDDKERDRPVLLKTFEEGQEPKEVRYENVGLAITYLKTVTEKLDPALKPLEDAHAQAQNRLQDANSALTKAEKALKDSQHEAKKGGALS